MRILLTGATGFVGLNLLRELRSVPGLDIACLVREAAGGRADAVRAVGGRVVEGDITDRDACLRAAAGREAVVHLAAHLSDWDPWRVFEAVNVRGTANMVEAAVASGCSHFIHMSTNDVFGFRCRGEVNEDSPHVPGPYGYCRSKAMAQEIVTQELGRAGIPWTVFYPMWIFGDGDRTFMPELVKMVKGGLVPVVGEGGAVPLTHVRRVCAAVKAALLSPGERNRGWFVMEESRLDWKGLLRAVAQGTGAKVRFLPVRRGVAAPVAALVEGVWRVLRIRSRPPITRYVIDNLANPARYVSARPPLPGVPDLRIDVEAEIRRLAAA